MIKSVEILLNFLENFAHFFLFAGLIQQCWRSIFFSFESNSVSKYCRTLEMQSRLNHAQAVAAN